MIEGYFIVLEGIDGSGKSTQAEMLGRWHRDRGLPVLVTHEPTFGPIGSVIHQVLTNRLVVRGITGPRFPAWTTMALLFAADRLDHLESEILPNLLDGVTVISDRYYLSNIAYQCASGSNSAPDPSAVQWLRTINNKARRPDLTIILDVAPESAARRRDERSSSADAYEENSFQEALAETYRRVETLVPNDRVVHVDGSLDMQSVHNAVVEAVRALRNGGNDTSH